MADGPEELFEVPLFPLNVVLFPSMALPLHIFEPRYRQMAQDCLADQAPFGVVLAQPEGDIGDAMPARVGTLARIVDYEKLPDGNYNMLTVGTRRFEIVEVRHTRSYLTGLVRPVRDVEGDVANFDALIAEARTALSEYLHVILTLVGSEDKQIEIPTDAVELSYLMGTCLACDDSDKQVLLEMTSVVERLQVGSKMLQTEARIIATQMENESQHPYNGDRSILN